jgi:hypothetical protein
MFISACHLDTYAQDSWYPGSARAGTLLSYTLYESPWDHLEYRYAVHDWVHLPLVEQDKKWVTFVGSVLGGHCEPSI